MLPHFVVWNLMCHHENQTFNRGDTEFEKCLNIHSNLREQTAASKKLENQQTA